MNAYVILATAISIAIVWDFGYTKIVNRRRIEDEILGVIIFAMEWKNGEGRAFPERDPFKKYGWELQRSVSSWILSNNDNLAIRWEEVGRWGMYSVVYENTVYIKINGKKVLEVAEIYWSRQFLDNRQVRFRNKRLLMEAKKEINELAAIARSCR